jgi:hypothetical protein
MIDKCIRSRGTVSRIGIAVTTAGVAGLALASPASATIIDQYIDVPQCAEPQTQVCQQIPTVPFRAKYDGPILMWFTANQNHCSDMIPHIIIDGTEWGTTERAGPGQRTRGHEIFMTKGDHAIGVQAEGIEGGCNIGFVSSWGGTLHIETTYDDSKGFAVPPPA